MSNKDFTKAKNIERMTEEKKLPEPQTEQLFQPPRLIGNVPNDAELLVLPPPNIKKGYEWYLNIVAITKSYYTYTLVKLDNIGYIIKIYRSLQELWRNFTSL